MSNCILWSVTKLLWPSYFNPKIIKPHRSLATLNIQQIFHHIFYATLQYIKTTNQTTRLTQATYVLIYTVGKKKIRRYLSPYFYSVREKVILNCFFVANPNTLRCSLLPSPIQTLLLPFVLHFPLDPMIKMAVGYLAWARGTLTLTLANGG